MEHCPLRPDVGVFARAGVTGAPICRWAAPWGRKYPSDVAVNIKVLIGSLSVAAIISIVGGYALSQSEDSGATPPPADDEITIPSNGAYQEPGLALNEPVEGEPLPIVTIEDDAGNDISTADLIGQPLVINVWSTTCEPCRRELPAFAAAHNEFGDQVRFVGINSGSDTSAEARAFAAEYGVNYESLRDGNGELIAALGIFTQPYTVFVRADGTIAVQKGLELSLDTIRSTITDSLLS